MIPPFPELFLDLFGVRIPAFTVTLSLAVLSFLILAERLARQKGLPATQSVVMAAAALGFGGIGSHLVMLLAYHPEIGLSGDWQQVANFGGMSSTGAILGGHLLAWFASRRYWSVEDCLRFQDSLIPAFGVALIIGRIGCWMAHEHLGVAADVWFAIDFPTGPQLDMALIELVLLVPITMGMFWVNRHARHAGMTLAFGFACHGLMRLVLDFWRVGEMTYFGFTPAQYLSIGFLVTALLVYRVARRGGSGEVRIAAPEAR